MVYLVRMVNQDLEVCQGLKAKQVQGVHQVLQGLKDQAAFQVHRDHQASQERRVSQGPLALPGPPDLQPLYLNKMLA